MCSRGVLVHCPSCLGAATTVLATKLSRGDGVLTEWALKLGEAVHHLDGVMSHSFNCRCLSLCEPELKLPSPRLRVKWQVLALTKRSMSGNDSFIDGRVCSLKEICDWVL
jgi:hypothetical protein